MDGPLDGHPKDTASRLVELPHVPEEQPPVRGDGGALRARLALKPNDVIDLVKNQENPWLNHGN